jgi:photosystem II stability/assembly factor-like uncharacterized protein
MRIKKINRIWIFLLPFVICLLSFAALKIINSNELNESEEYEEYEEFEEEEGYDKPEGYAEFYHLITTPIGHPNNGYKTNYRYKELQKALKNCSSSKSTKSTYLWEQRGPGNVGGRTREVIIDPDDPSHNTWYAAAASGGIWKTTDGGETWQNLTDQISNLATNSIAMAPSNHDIIYIGTGEGYGGYGMVSGNGIFKSINRGQTWELLESTVVGDAFRWVNKIIVDNYDADILLVATNEGIFKSYDGGSIWDTVYHAGYQVQDMVVNSIDPSTIYAGVNSLGIIKSYNNGTSWFDSYSGIGTGYRFSVTMSPVDTNYIYTSVEAPQSVTELYISSNGGGSWNKHNDFDNSFINFHGEQGWFNNVIEADPFNKYKVFVGGVYLGSLTFKSSTTLSDPQVIRVDTLGTGSFMAFVNFGGNYLRGALSTGLDEEADVQEEDYTSIEIRFGPGISQKAHRFTVPEGEGAGVPRSDFHYEDYISVPFQAWDVDHNKQLMVSFRDQEGNGEFNLIERIFDDDISGREYIYVHAVDYSASPNADIAKDGGHLYKMLYFLWPTLPEDKTWQPNNLPLSKISVKYGTLTLQNASTTVLADEDRNSNLHVDHHDMKIIVTDELNQQFSIIETNDGGLGRSDDKGLTWRQIKNGYNTSQFYGIAKKPGAFEFIGGMQDNGTWQSPSGEIAGPGSAYNDRVKGDGFEAIWHPDYPNRILASSYYNSIHLSTDGGENWSLVTDGMTGNGPFITRLSNSPANPNLVLAVGNKGVYRHTNFCVGRYPWQLVEIDSGWAPSGVVTSAHNVKVSLADPAVVWAGAGMFNDPDLNIFLSKDYGESFEKVTLYSEQELGFLTSIATHPTDTGTAYLLFSIDHKPKILRTTDFGVTWNDISGFGAGDSSQNGFPDVIVYSLLVFPNNTNIIWVGTEIGIFESLDSGLTWHYADNGFPSVSVWQMFLQDNTLVIATHGRGIWTTSQRPDAIPEIHLDEPRRFNLFPNPGNGIINIEFDSPDHSNGKINLYSLTGDKIYSESFMKDDISFKRQFDFSFLNKGSYIISIAIGTKSFNKQFVIE